MEREPPVAGTTIIEVNVSLVLRRSALKKTRMSMLRHRREPVRYFFDLAASAIAEAVQQAEQVLGEAFVTRWGVADDRDQGRLAPAGPVLLPAAFTLFCRRLARADGGVAGRRNRPCPH